jgi:hypothetical protein
MRYFLLLVCLLVCLSCSIAGTDHPGTSPEVALPSDPMAVTDADQFTGNVAFRDNALNSQNRLLNTYRVHFGPQVVMVRASYRGDNDAKSQSHGTPPASDPSYFDLRATSAVAGTSLIGEGEMAYRVSNSLDENMRPEMFRLGLKDRWRGFTYGADYKSIAKGFVGVTGVFADQSRDEALVWGEHPLGPLKLRGSITESWEHVAELPDVRVTRTAATTLQINRAGWGVSFSTSYGLIGQGPNEDNAVLIKSLATSFRPSDFLLVEPNFSVKEEWNHSTGVRTETPSSGLQFTYSPLKSGFKLTGATSFSRTFSRDGYNDLRIHGTSAAVDWRLGKFVGQADSLSFSFNYNRQLDSVSRSNSRSGLSSMLQFKVAGF